MHHYENTQPGTFIRVMTGSWVVLFGVLVVVMLALGQKEAAILLGVVTVGIGTNQPKELLAAVESALASFN